MFPRPFVLWAGALGVLATACNSPASKPPLETEDQKTLYAMGYALAGTIHRLELKPEELDALIAGVREGAGGTPARVKLEDYREKISALDKTRWTAAAKVEKEQANAFLSQEAAAEGATTLPSGIVKRIIQEGSGASPESNDTVKFHYHGTLRDGTVFNSSVDRGEPAEFPLNRVIPCWSEALQTMKVGEKAHITCPSDIAYGDRGMPPTIKGGAALAFDIELLEIVKPEATKPTANATPQQ